VTPILRKQIKLRGRRLYFLALIAVLWILCAQCSHPRKQAQARSAPTIKVWYGNEQSFGELGNPQQWINILGNVSGSSIMSLSYSLNRAPSTALAIGPSTKPPGEPACAEPLTISAQDTSNGVRSGWLYRARRIWNDCKSDSLRTCAKRHARMWLSWIGQKLGKSPPAPPRRLYEKGDFNVEININKLRQGPNMVTLTAIDGLNRTTTLRITVNYTNGRTWPLPYAIDWKRVDNTSRAVQIVDGRWTKTSDGLRTAQIGYDRVFAIGDLKWTDYEITVPIKVHSVDRVGSNNPVSGGASLGLLTHWRGHSFNPIKPCECSQPRCGWYPSGVSGWIEFWSSGSQPPVYQIQDVSGTWAFLRRKPELNTWYIWKVRTQMGKNQKYKYWMKLWRRGVPEPAKWDLEGVDANYNSSSGSILLDAHHVDATFGNITIIPGPFTDSSAVVAGDSR
jgi:hypothetical protein